MTSDELGFEEIVFVKRKPYSSDHYYTDINNGTSPDRFLPENGIYIYNLRTRSERAVVTAAQLPGGKGFIGKISLSFDARKVLFDFRQDPGSGFRIWEVGIDGTGLRQVSFPPNDEAEKVARWARAGTRTTSTPATCRTARSSSPRPAASTPFCAAGPPTWWLPTLHRMDADGTHVEQLTKSPVSEFCPVVLDDGRVMYHRWEYIDKGARVAKTIWSMNPDGTRPQELYGLADDTTTVYMYPQPLPGSDHRLVCVGTCHFPQGGCLGPILLVDYGRGCGSAARIPDEADYVQGRPRYPVINITPHVFVQRRTEPGWHFRTEGRQVCARSRGPAGAPLHASLSRQRPPVPGFVQGQSLRSLQGGRQRLRPVPDRHRGRPPRWFTPTDSSPAGIRCRWSRALSRRGANRARDPAVRRQQPGRLRRGQCLPGHGGGRAGEVKWLRINEALPRYWSTGRRWEPSLSSSSWKAALWPRVQWGVVPVEKDGSAHFRRAGQSQHLLPGPGRELPGSPARADVCELRARRGAFLHGLSRAIAPHGGSRAPPRRRSR